MAGPNDKTQQPTGTPRGSTPAPAAPPTGAAAVANVVVAGGAGPKKPTRSRKSEADRMVEALTALITDRTGRVMDAGLDVAGLRQAVDSLRGQQLTPDALKTALGIEELRTGIGELRTAVQGLATQRPALTLDEETRALLAGLGRSLSPAEIERIIRTAAVTPATATPAPAQAGHPEHHDEPKNWAKWTFVLAAVFVLIWCINRFVDAVRPTVDMDPIHVFARMADEKAKIDAAFSKAAASSPEFEEMNERVKNMEATQRDATDTLRAIRADAATDREKMVAIGKSASDLSVALERLQAAMARTGK